jgi:formylglycine-generating enzyme required for sulfatase activity
MYYASWNDATEFAAQLTGQERKVGRLSAGNKYTLPTEAQWDERAARAPRRRLMPARLGVLP